MTKSAQANLPDTSDAAFSLARFVLLLAVFVTISFPEIVFGSHTFTYRDDGIFGYPVAYYFRHCFWQGEVPLWNPYNHCGIPFLAQWNTMVCYPLSLFYLLLPMPWSMNYFLIGHVFLAGAGMYLLAYRWYGNRFAATVAGLVFAWNGLSVNLFIWPCHIAALAWMPWVVLLCEEAMVSGGRRLFLAALAGACQMTTGSPEMILFTWVIVLALGIGQWRGAKTLLRFFTIAGLVASLSAVQLAPWLDFVAHGDRSANFDAGQWSLPLWGVANFLVPLFRAQRSVAGVFWQPGQELFSSYYSGIVTMALALIALLKVRERKTLFLAVFGLGGILCAFGNTGHVLPALKKIAPFLGFARYPVKFLFITLFSLPLLAAAGTKWLQAQANVTARRNLLLATAVIGCGIALVLAVSWKYPFAGETWPVTWHSGASRFAILLLGLGILWRVPTSHPVLFGFGLLFLMGADICTHKPREIPTVPVEAYDDISPAMSSLPKLGQARAMTTPQVDLWMNHLSNPSDLRLYLGHRAGLFGDCNLLNLIPKVDGFFSLNLREQHQVAELFNRPQPLPNLAQFLGVSQLTSTKELFTWETEANFMPMATIGQSPVFLNDAATLEALVSPQFKPREIVYLPVEARAVVSVTADPAAKVLSSKITAAQCQFETEAGHPAMLVVAQSWYHCWKASIDGQPTPLFRANHAFQAVVVPAGRHTVQLIYHDAMFYLGALISFFSLAACAVGLGTKKWTS